MGRRAPYLAFGLALALIALIGVPPTGLFMAKLYIFSAAVNSDLAWLAVVGVINSVVSAYYYLRVVRVMYLEPSPDEERVPASQALRASLGISALGILVIGIVPGPLLRLAELSVDVLPQVAGVAGHPGP
jgi:NADH-quinone oxidoreductase subunit N